MQLGKPENKTLTQIKLILKIQLVMQWQSRLKTKINGHPIKDVTEITIDQIPQSREDINSPRLMFTNFALLKSLRRADGMLYGWFSPSFAGACIMNYEGGIHEQSIRSMRVIGNCGGISDPIVMVEHV